MRRELNHDFFKKWSPAMAYILGYFAADGSMLKNSRGGCYIEFTTTDRCMLDHIRSATLATQSISDRANRNQNWKQQYRIQIGSKVWFSDLTLLGFTQAKSNTLSIPVISENFVGDFVRGYFDGDGCVYFGKLKYADRTYKRWVLITLFTSGSKLFLDSLWKILKTHGITGGSIQEKNRGFELKFSHRDSLALYRLMYHTAGVSNMFLPRKREKLERAITILGLDK